MLGTVWHQDIIPFFTPQLTMVSWPRIHFLPGTCGQQSIEGGQWTYFFVGEAVSFFDSHMKFLLGTFSLHVIILDIHTYYLTIWIFMIWIACMGPFLLTILIHYVIWEFRVDQHQLVSVRLIDHRNPVGDASGGLRDEQPWRSGGTWWEFTIWNRDVQIDFLSGTNCETGQFPTFLFGLIESQKAWIRSEYVEQGDWSTYIPLMQLGYA